MGPFYWQIPVLANSSVAVLLPVLPTSVTLKFYSCYQYQQILLLANSTTVIFTANFHYLQIQRHHSYPCLIRRPRSLCSLWNFSL